VVWCGVVWCGVASCRVAADAWTDWFHLIVCWAFSLGWRGGREVLWVLDDVVGSRSVCTSSRDGLGGAQRRNGATVHRCNNAAQRHNKAM
jgi:hypothetical protein